MVEDSLPGVRAGVAADMRMLAYASGYDEKALQGAGGSVFTSIAELPTLLKF